MDQRTEIREFLASRRARITTPEPASASQDALDFLAGWAATVDQAETAQAPDQA